MMYAISKVFGICVLAVLIGHLFCLLLIKLLDSKMSPFKIFKQGYPLISIGLIILVCSVSIVIIPSHVLEGILG